jgi:hypothetical protein
MLLASLVCTVLLAACAYREMAGFSNATARKQQGLALMLLKYIPA